jgi:hypothetical protein
MKENHVLESTMCRQSPVILSSIIYETQGGPTGVLVFLERNIFTKGQYDI